MVRFVCAYCCNKGRVLSGEAEHATSVTGVASPFANRTSVDLGSTPDSSICNNTFSPQFAVC